MSENELGRCCITRFRRKHEPETVESEKKNSFNFRTVAEAEFKRHELHVSLTQSSPVEDTFDQTFMFPSIHLQP